MRENLRCFNLIFFLIFSYYIEGTTNAVGAFGADEHLSPDKPNFDYEIIPNESLHNKVKITWKPNVSGQNPGSHFYVQYRKKGESSFVNADPVINEEFSEVGGLEPDTDYEFRVVSVDGLKETPSENKLLRTSDSKCLFPTLISILLIIIIYR